MERADATQVDNDSRFVLTKRNDSLALDAREMNVSKKKKTADQGFDGDSFDHNGYKESESSLISHRIC